MHPHDWPVLCPHCGEHASVQTREDGRPLRLVCPAGHRYDAARQGHLNLLTGKGSKHLEDTAAMVASRERWLDSGAYAPIAAGLAALAGRHLSATPDLLVDTGSGTGWYTRAVLDAVAAPSLRAVDLDLSRAGAQRAARDPRVLSLVWDTWKPWPLAAGCADLLLDVFAPRNEEEFARVLRPGGLALVAVPLPQHLAALRGEAGLLGIDEHKEERLAAAFGRRWDEVEALDIEFTLDLDAAAAADLAHMGPAGHHRRHEEIAADLSGTPTRSIDAAVRLHAYRRR